MTRPLYHIISSTQMKWSNDDNYTYYVLFENLTMINFGEGKK